MTEPFSNPVGRHSVAVLLHPSAVPVIDVFRSIGNLEDQYDLALLDGPERALSAYVTPSAAKGIVSDALLLAFSLSRKRQRSFDHRPLRSRCGSLDEYCLLVLIGASRQPDSDLAREASAYLDGVSLDLLSALAGELTRQIDQGAIVFPVPPVSEFRAMIGREGRMPDVLVETFGQPGRHLGL